MILPYDTSKDDRDRIIKERQAKMAAAFERMREKIDEQTSEMNMSTVSERVRRQQLEEIRNELQKSLGAYYSGLEAGLKSDMESIGQSVLNESEGFYNALNMPIAMSITSFPVEIMNNIVNGSIYEQKWYLSQALWGDYKDKIDDINEVVTQGIGLNLSALEIAKNLQQYVDPKAMQPSKSIKTPCLRDPVTGKLYSADYAKRHPDERDWSKFKEETSTYRFGKVDYNAQRLTRTLINHAYQQNVVHQAQANPFAKGVKWLASGGLRMCEICEERDGKIFPADDVPLDHPNGMCTFEVVTELGMMEMSDVLADFVNGVPTDYDDALYKWYNDRADVPVQRSSNRFAQHVIANGNDLSGKFTRREDQFDFLIEDVINAQGFDGVPQVVSSEEFDRAVSESNFIAQRVYSAPDQETLDLYRNQLYNGKWYVDCSNGGAAFGKGMYAVYNNGTVVNEYMEREMNGYRVRRGAEHSYTETFTLVPDAKTITPNELIALRREVQEKINAEFKARGGWRSEEAINWASEHDVSYNRYDDGSFAALMGYDAILTSGLDDYAVILNRTKVIFKGE